MRRLILGLLMITTLGAFAQKGKYGETPQDSVKCVEALNIYPLYVKNDIPLALKHWRTCCKVCPGSSKNLYINGAKMYQDLIEKNEKTNKELAVKYYDTLLMVYDNRIKYFGQEAYVLGRKGTDMLKYGDDPCAAYEVLKKSVDAKKGKSSAGTLYYLTIASTRCEKAGTINAEQVLEQFGHSSQYADEAIKYYKSKGKQDKADQYMEVQGKMVKNVGYLITCEILVPMAQKGYDANKDNAGWLSRMGKFLKAKDCTDEEIFSTIAVRLYELEPTASSAAIIAQMYVKQKDFGKAVEFAKKATETAEANDPDLADYYYLLAVAENFAGSKSSARSHALKAAGLREGFGDPYYLIGNMYAASASSVGTSACTKGAVYCLAVDMMNKCAAVTDNDELKKKAGSAAASFKKYYPESKDCFFEGIKEGQSVDVGGWIGQAAKVSFR